MGDQGVGIIVFLFFVFFCAVVNCSAMAGR